jgi:CheY-like chemotaxis protein
MPMSQTNVSTRRFNILLVEDDPDDVLLTQLAFRMLPFAIDCQSVENGLEALAYLQSTRTHEHSLPDLILLDLNLPRMDGREFLAEVKRTDPFSVIPVIVLSTSANEDDVLRAYRNHASAYMIKPIDMTDFHRRIRCLAEFWLSDAVALPSRTMVHA